MRNVDHNSVSDVIWLGDEPSDSAAGAWRWGLLLPEADISSEGVSHKTAPSFLCITKRVTQSGASCTVDLWFTTLFVRHTPDKHPLLASPSPSSSRSGSLEINAFQTCMYYFNMFTGRSCSSAGTSWHTTISPPTTTSTSSHHTRMNPVWVPVEIAMWMWSGRSCKRSRDLMKPDLTGLTDMTEHHTSLNLIRATRSRSVSCL